MMGRSYGATNLASDVVLLMNMNSATCTTVVAPRNSGTSRNHHYARITSDVD
jgi:hypothetical protein